MSSKKNSDIINSLEGSEIAVIGMACRFPGARNPVEFWSNLCNGVESISFLSDEELLSERISPELLNNPNYIKAASILDDFDKFDAAFFGYTPKEAELMDPQHRLFLECAWEALEDAGYNPESYKGSVGVYGGAKTDTYLFNISSNRELLKSLDAFQIALGNDLGCLSTRVSYKLDLKGPSYAVHTACSTSLVAVHLACQSLLIDECRMALAGGVTVNVPHRVGYLYQPGGIMSPDGHCRAFDAKAGGTVFGSGVGVVALKRLEDAISDRDQIYAVIKGSATNNDGSKKASYTAPGVEGQTRVIMEALAVAGVNADSISYIETHGTGTSLGDPIEVLALTGAFRASTSRNGFCAIGSVKSNLGHLDSAAGISSLIKTVLALKHGKLPPSLHYEQPNPKIDFDNSPFYVNTELTEWRTNGIPRHAGVSSFGFGSTNAHIILEEAPTLEKSGKSKAWQLLLMSARTQTALDRMTVNLAEYFSHNPGTSLEDAAYTLKAGRKVFKYRRAVLCRSVEEAVRLMRADSDKTGLAGCEEQLDRPVRVYFDGEGISCINTSRLTYMEEPAFKYWMDKCAEVFLPLLKLDVRNVLYSAKGQEVEASQQSASEKVSRCAAFALQFGLGKTLLESGVCPVNITGCGIGYVVAECLSGNLSLEDAATKAVNGILQKEGPAAAEDRNSICVEIGMGVQRKNPANRYEGEGNSGLIIPYRLNMGDENADSGLLATVLGQLWISGAHIDWSRYYADEVRHRISLPTYPFERQRYWIDPVEKPDVSKIYGRVQERRVTLEKKYNLDEWFYIPVWKLSPISCQYTFEKFDNKNCVGLIFDNESGLGEAISNRLKKYGMDVVCVGKGQEFRQIGADRFVINPSEKSNYSLLIDKLMKADDDSTNREIKIFFLWNIAMGDNEQNSDILNHIEALDKNIEYGFYSPVYLAQAIGENHKIPDVDISIVSSNLHAITGNEALYPGKAVIIGPTRVIPREYRNISCRSIDVETDFTDNSKYDVIADRIISEAFMQTMEPFIAYRDSNRWILDIEPLNQEVKADEKITRKISGKISDKISLRENGVYMITGGLGGIGFVLANHLAETVRARLILTGRTTLPPEEEWEKWLETHDHNNEISRKILKIRTLEQRGASVKYISVEVTDKSGMQKVISDIAEHYGRIYGVIHAAGSGSSGMIQMKTHESAQAVLAPRIAGTLILDELFSDAGLDFLILCSSLQTTMGDFGQVDYCAANAFMDAFAVSRKYRKGTPVIAIDWDNWGETGVAFNTDVPEELRKWRNEILEKGLKSSEGIEVFKRVLENPKSQVIISTQDLYQRKKLADSINRDEILEEMGTSILKGEIPAKQSVSAKYDIIKVSAGELEHQITDIWKRVLGVDKVGLNDNFFDLGGNSLSGLYLISELKNEFHIELAPVVLYEAPTISTLVRYLKPVEHPADELYREGTTQTHTKTIEDVEQDGIAIIGMACRLPGAANIDEFWDNLVNGVESVTFFSREELEAEGVEESLLNDPNYVKAAQVIGNVDLFDASFFGYTPREAELMDPQQRLFMECAWEALENAGYDSEKYKGAIGVYGGTSMSTYLFNLYSNKGLIESVGSTQAVIGNDKDALTTSVSYKLNLRGPSVSVQTFCSTSLVAVHMACKGLLDGECDMAMAGGSSIRVPEKNGYLYQDGGIMSRDGHCRAFDAGADGTVFGNGVGIVLLKRLKDTVADRDHIYAVIKGSAVNNDGSLKVGFTAPSVEGQAAVIADAIRNAGIDTDTIGYLEAHGTGTQMGDPIEIAALTKAFRTHTERKGFCAIGSVKSNIGHLDRASGIVGLIKTALILKHGVIPPTLNFDAVNSKIDFLDSPFYLNNRYNRWVTDGISRRAGISSLGFGGTNAHIVLEEASQGEFSDSTEQYHLLLLSARTESALKNVALNLSGYLKRNPGVNLADMSYTLQAGRKSFDFRRALVCRDIAEAADLLENVHMTNMHLDGEGSDKKAITFRLPGRYSEYVNLGEEIYRNIPLFQEKFNTCAEIIRTLTDIDLCILMYPNEREIKESAARFEESELLKRLAAFTFEYSLFKILMELGVCPDRIIGCGAGEITSACIAGVFSSEAALLLIIEYYKPIERKHECGDIPESVRGIHYENPLIPCFSYITGIRMTGEDVGNPHYWAGCLNESANNASKIDDTLLSPNIIDYSGLLNFFGSLWRDGADICWSKLYRGGKRRRIPLPAYPFERKRYWIEPGNQKEASEDTLHTKEMDGEHVYIPTWRRSGSIRPFIKGQMTVDDRCWLVFSDKSSFACDIMKLLCAEKQTVITVQAGDGFKKKDSGVYVINPAHKKDYYLLMEDLKTTGMMPDCAIHLWSCIRPFSERTTAGLDDHYYKYGINSLLSLARSFSGVFPKNNMSIWTLVDDLHEVYGRESLCPEKLIAVGACKAINHELVKIICRCIDIEIFQGNTGISAELALSEICGEGTDFIVAHRGGYRWLPDLEQAETVKTGTALMPLKDEGVYLIVNGFEETGAAFSRYLARTVRAKQVLLDSSKLPPREQWKHYITPESRECKDMVYRPIQEDAPNPDTLIKTDGLNEYIQTRENKLSDEFKAATPPESLEGDVNILCAGYIYGYIFKGITAAKGNTWNMDALKSELKVIPKFEKFFNYMISELEKDGIISVNHGNIALLKDPDEIIKLDSFSEELKKKYPEIKEGLSALDYCLSNYIQALSGEVDAVSVLYPEGSSGMIMSVTENQDRFSNVRLYKDMITEVLCRIEKAYTGRKLKVLEIGAGDGKLTWDLVSALKDKNIEYYFTDIGRSFVLNAKDKAAREDFDFMEFIVFDILKDPVTQGLDFYSFDVILALDVVHATPDIRKSMECLKRLLVPGGLILLVEATSPQRWVNMIWGLAEGWWYFSDEDIRQHSPLMSSDMWEAVLSKQGFENIRVYPSDTVLRNAADHSLIVCQQPYETDSENYRAWQAGKRRKEMQHIHDRVRHVLQLEQIGSKVLPLSVDPLDEEQVRQAVARCHEVYGGLDGIIYVLKAWEEEIPPTIEKMGTHEYRKKMKDEISFLYTLDRILNKKPYDFSFIISSSLLYAGDQIHRSNYEMALFASCFSDRSKKSGNIKWTVIDCDVRQPVKKENKDVSYSKMMGAIQNCISHACLSQAIATARKDEDVSMLWNKLVLSHEHLRSGIDNAASENENEQIISDMWKEILGISNIGTHDSFFDLGGDSLQATQLNSRLRKIFNVELPMQRFFEFPTIRETASAVEEVLADQRKSEEMEVLSMLERLSEEEVELEIKRRL